MTEAVDEAALPLVLVVDDDARSRELLRLVLRHAGYRVIAAGDAPAAVALLQVEHPEVALVDLLMPGMNGIDFCRWVRTRAEFASMKFVLLTGMDTRETVDEARDAGADDVVTKPFDRLQLLERLRALRAS